MARYTLKLQSVGDTKGVGPVFSTVVDIPRLTPPVWGRADQPDRVSLILGIYQDEWETLGRPVDIEVDL